MVGREGAYARDKNTSARLCAKMQGGGIFAGHYGTMAMIGTH